MAVRVGINGFGRIGRLILRAALDHPDFDAVAINDLTDAETLAHLFRHDSIHGPLAADVRAADGRMTVNGRDIQVTSLRDPAQLPWKALEVDVALECTGHFTEKASALKHLAAGAKKVIISAPAKDPDLTICMGVNEGMYNPAVHHVLSNASCTTNCLAPVAKVIHEAFTIEQGWMTTIHAYTNDQRLLDLEHKDLRRARAATLSMIPTTTGAARAVSLVLPALKGKLDGIAIRVPTPNVSLVDLVARVGTDVTAEQVNTALRAAEAGPLRGILRVCDEPLVSIDFNHDAHSAVVDAALTAVLEKRLVKVLAWYDNEWGFSCRMRDVTLHIARDVR